MNTQETISFLQEELSASQQNTLLFQSIFKAIPDAVAFADLERRIVMMNSSFAKTFGYQKHELIGKKTDIIYANREEYERQGKIRFHLNSKEKLQPYEVVYRKKDGTIFPGETVGAPIRDETGKTYGFIGVIRDISNRKKAEDSLRKLEFMYRTAANFTYDWELWTNLDSTFRYVSPSCERITGYTADQFMQHPNLFREIIVPEDRKAWDEHHHDAHEVFKLREIQFRIKRQDGSIGWIEHACQPVVGQQGEVLGVRSSNRDITERKKVEEDLRWALSEIKKYKEKLEEESACLRKEIKLVCNYKRIIGSSNALQYVLFKIEQIAPTDTTVIIFGETGTGKELIARAVYEHSLRKGRSMLTVNCATLPTNLIESELFGHEKGAFTGAHARKIGRFETASGGTLFLDEIGELPLEAQAKLLRVLQNGELERLGSSRTTKVDCVFH
ncbi:MAG: sigma 54-interacting transcriptional regulator [Thermodesulfobacteriota bacterium]